MINAVKQFVLAVCVHLAGVCVAGTILAVAAKLLHSYVTGQ